ncbi:MAG: RNA polymerase sigma factor [Planctomycetota bacterium]|jgi:RNA polymerase sigma-70 factor (ECF subfamily)
MSPEAEFKDLVDLHYEDLWSYASYCSLGQGEVEDILHEAFLAAFERLRKGEPFAGDPLHWLRAVIRNKSRTLWRKRTRLLTADAEVLETLIPEVDAPLDTLVKQEAEGSLLSCIGHLGEEERELLDERYADGTRIERMAEEKGVKAETLRTKLFRLRRRLKSCLEEKLPGWNEL